MGPAEETVSSEQGSTQQSTKLAEGVSGPMPKHEDSVTLHKVDEHGGKSRQYQMGNLE